ncbi:MAG: polyhydroxyalkanoate synthesis repressor PhaR [Gammaproteobacteria bacterium]|nr:polyhydroxyalkanoate synthesis repressor PhaR [Gammaproteobacteria bacterium]MDH3435235.1 polyhydroxyalkanoate synthesis repressor PhaR [Gammaproteobacteria bacterium]
MTTARTIRKYPNRRLYDSEESRYITLADIKKLVLSNTDFVVIDKKSGTDITRSILLQVIRDQEQNGEAIMSQDFLTQVICCHGNVAPGFLAQHLEQSLRQFIAEPQNRRNNELVGSLPDPAKNTLTSGP